MITAFCALFQKSACSKVMGNSVLFFYKFLCSIYEIKTCDPSAVGCKMCEAGARWVVSGRIG